MIHHSENLVKETFSSRTWTSLLTTKDRDHSLFIPFGQYLDISLLHTVCSTVCSAIGDITEKVLYDTFSSFGNILSCKVVDEGDGGRYS